MGQIQSWKILEQAMSVNVNRDDAVEIIEMSGMLGSYVQHEVFQASDKRMGYMSDHYVLKVETVEESRKFFLKVVPNNVEKRVAYLNETGFFEKETNIYEKVIATVSPYSSISWAPKCYGFKDQQFIIMEILDKFKSFSTIDMVFDLGHMKLAASTLAVFHASSVIYEAKTGKSIGVEFKDVLEENAYPLKEGHIRMKSFDNAVEALSALVRVIPKYQARSDLDDIVAEFAKVMRRILTSVQPSQKYRNVFNHGDLWANNIMFSYQSEIPVNCKFVDFQLSRYATPAMDLADLIYINSTKAFRAEHLEEVLEVYCQALEDELGRAQLDLSALPRREVLEHFAELKAAGLIDALLFCNITLLPPVLSTTILTNSEEFEQFISQSRVDTCLAAFKEEYFRKRMTEILCELIDEFVLEN